jgi:hypothetical protein
MHIVHKRTKSHLKSILIALPISFIGWIVKMDFRGYFVIFSNLMAKMLKKSKIYIKTLDKCIEICYNSCIN